ncbi:MAG: Hsp70 family protein, partial [Armatimonadetes bacterium]|nr:Hsp70 family protein [Armatimonadota bacterium]
MADKSIIYYANQRVHARPSIQRMRQEAEEHASEDRRKKELAEARNQADHLCYQVEKLIREHAAQLSDDDRRSLEKAVEKTRQIARAEDVVQIRSAISELEQAMHAFSKTLYEKATTADAAQN